MNLSFRKKGVLHVPVNSWELDDGNTVVIYQGSRGANPDLDFIVKYKAPNKRLRAPSHTHWIVDLIIKHGFSPNVVKDFVLDWLNLYDIIEPFKTEDERINYELIVLIFSFITIDLSKQNLSHKKLDQEFVNYSLYLKGKKKKKGK